MLDMAESVVGAPDPVPLARPRSDAHDVEARALALLYREGELLSARHALWHVIGVTSPVSSPTTETPRPVHPPPIEPDAGRCAFPPFTPPSLAEARPVRTAVYPQRLTRVPTIARACCTVCCRAVYPLPLPRTPLPSGGVLPHTDASLHPRASSHPPALIVNRSSGSDNSGETRHATRVTASGAALLDVASPRPRKICVENYMMEIRWLEGTYIAKDQGHIRKSEAYAAYTNFCADQGIRPHAANFFAKLLRRVFPGARNGRLGGRSRGVPHFINIAPRHTPARDTVRDADAETKAESGADPSPSSVRSGCADSRGGDDGSDRMPPAHPVRKRPAGEDRDSSAGGKRSYLADRCPKRPRAAREETPEPKSERTPIGLRERRRLRAEGRNPGRRTTFRDPAEKR